MYSANNQTDSIDGYYPGYYLPEVEEIESRIIELKTIGPKKT